MLHRVRMHGSSQSSAAAGRNCGALRELMIKGRDCASFLWEAMHPVACNRPGLAVWVHAASLCLAGAQRIRPPVIRAIRLAGSKRNTVAVVQDQEAAAGQLAYPPASRPSRGAGRGLPSCRRLQARSAAAHAGSAPRSCPIAVLCHQQPAELWHAGGVLHAGSAACQRIPHRSALRATQVAVVLHNFAGSPFERIQLVNEGMLGAAVNPGGCVLGYTMLFAWKGARAETPNRCSIGARA